MSNEKLLQALKDALSFEEKGEQIYRDIALRSEDHFIKNMFNSLADDEVEHERVIDSYSKHINQDTLFDFEKELEQVKDNNPRRIFNFSIQEFKSMVKFEQEDLEPFDIAIKLEESAIKFYTEKLIDTEDEESKHFFHFLIQQEEMHRSSLIKAKDFLANPEDNFNEMESWILDGA